MAYRLFCIYETYAKPSVVLRIEVCQDGVGKSLPPFIRKVTLNDLYKEGVSSDPQMLALINHAGLQSQPFRIDHRLLQDSQVIKLLKDHHDIYIESQPKGSIRKAPCPILSGSHANCCNIVAPTIGQLMGGELYIDHPSTWNREIKVRLRYAETLSPFFPDYSPLPYLTRSGQLFQRDKQAEDLLLATLGESFNPATQALSLKSADTETLSELTKKGWTLYVANKQKQHSRTYAHHTPTGITWFSTNEIEKSSDFAQLLLDGYLNSRNYQESEGTITLFQREDAVKADDKSLAQQLGASGDVLRLYNSPQPLTVEETHAIDTLLAQHLQARLWPYQRDGVLWLQQQRKNGHGCLLADEMGLGKTIQTIAHLCCLNSEARHLVIAPTSLIYNWQNEVRQFAPDLLSSLTFGSYDMLRIHLSDYTRQSYDTIIIDEAQVIKNRQTKKYQAVGQLHCKHKIILTGTPIENSIDELWSHFMMLMPSLRNLHQRLVCLGIPAVHEVYVTLSGKLLKPFILRREKQTVLTDLPERIEKTVYIELSEQERTIYRQVHTSILQAFASGVNGRVSSIALEGLLRLRQACVSPHLLPDTITGSTTAKSTKLHIALDYITNFRDGGRQVLVFSQFKSALVEMEQILREHHVRFVTLYGDTLHREVPVKRFQSDSSITVFLISLKAGGFGLNLTSADRVILLDDWWNPAVEDQAMGRAHRIGQHHNVLVLRLVCKDTVEEKILQLQSQKRQTIDLFNATSDKLTIEELKALID